MGFETISAVLPAYNEEASLEVAARTVVEVLSSLPMRAWELIIVDDGSVDATGSIADRLATDDPRIRVFHLAANQGYAAALRTGFQNAAHQLIFYTDSDNQFDVRQLADMLPLIERVDIVSGYRIQRHDSWGRLILSWGYNLLVRLLLGVRVRDIDCAFKLFRREVFEKVTIESRNFFVDAEILAKAAHHQFRMAEIGVRHYPRQAGQSSVHSTRVLSTVLELLRMWLRTR